MTQSAKPNVDVKPSSQSVESVIELTSSTAESVQALLQFLYDIKQLSHIWHTLNLANQYKIRGLIDLLQSYISSFPLTPANVKEVAQCAGHLTQPGDLLTRCMNLSYNQFTLITLVALGKQCYNRPLVAG